MLPRAPLFVCVPCALVGQDRRTLGPSLPHIALAVKTHHHFSSAPVLAQALEASKRTCSSLYSHTPNTCLRYVEAPSTFTFSEICAVLTYTSFMITQEEGAGPRVRR